MKVYCIKNKTLFHRVYKINIYIYIYLFREVCKIGHRYCKKICIIHDEDTFYGEDNMDMQFTKNNDFT